ncbi:MAG: response regulator receiver [Ignavibacteria bacterium]|nr:MAG: response regulator receiver [Ignavibacteria bacterium]KAF0156409.1 MAG: response regulator receiver [Ignavibacteria bacterium]
MAENAIPAILVVEDDFENQKFLKIFLKRSFEVKMCDNDEEFYNILNNNHIDIILMDISLRGNKDGFQLTKELKASEKFKNIPIVGLSAHALRKDKDNASNAGVDVFLTKPVDANVLLNTLLNALEGSTKKLL